RHTLLAGVLLARTAGIAARPRGPVSMRLGLARCAGVADLRTSAAARCGDCQGFAVGLGAYGAAVVGSEEADVAGAVAGFHVGGWGVVAVVGAGGDDRDLGVYGVEEAGGAGRAAPVVRHLDDLRGEVRRVVEESSFSPRFDVASQQNADVTEAEAERQGGVVQRHAGRVARRVKHLRADRERGKRGALGEHPGRSRRGGERGLESLPLYAVARHARPPELAGVVVRE